MEVLDGGIDEKRRDYSWIIYIPLVSLCGYWIYWFGTYFNFYSSLGWDGARSSLIYHIPFALYLLIPVCFPWYLRRKKWAWGVLVFVWGFFIIQSLGPTYLRVVTDLHRDEIAVSIWHTMRSSLSAPVFILLPGILILRKRLVVHFNSRVWAGIALALAGMIIRIFTIYLQSPIVE
ncbi:MAG: hypothetical protein MK081_16055 [Flavobacteriales bacterium]|nr:hypothetical protein [Flavobacteriales bacterium]